METDNPTDSAMVLVLTGYQNTSHGSLDLQTDGGFSYTPNLDFAGKDSFTYTVCDAVLVDACKQATVTINVLNIAADDVYKAITGSSLVVGAPGVLENDNPTDSAMGLVLTDYQNTSHGNLNLKLNGGFTYKPNAGFAGKDSFTYNVCDAALLGACGRATALLNVIKPYVAPPKLIGLSKKTAPIRRVPPQKKTIFPVNVNKANLYDSLKLYLDRNDNKAFRLNKTGRGKANLVFKGKKKKGKYKAILTISDGERRKTRYTYAVIVVSCKKKNWLCKKTKDCCYPFKCKMKRGKRRCSK